MQFSLPVVQGLFETKYQMVGQTRTPVVRDLSETGSKNGVKADFQNFHRIILEMM